MKDYYGRKKLNKSYGNDSYYEMKYTEYREDGSIKGRGIEDFSGARLDTIHFWGVWFKTERKNKGGHTIWENIGEVWTDNVKNAKKIAIFRFGRMYVKENIALRKII